MGLCLSSLTPEEKENLDTSKLIDKMNRADLLKDAISIKLLLLGAGESGKSTIFKQMRILYGSGYTEADRAKFKIFIHANILETVASVCKAVESLGYHEEISDENIKNLIQTFLNINTEVGATELTPVLAQQIFELWADETIKKVLVRSNEFQIPSSFPYFFSKIHDIALSEYLPTIEDVLYSRARTTGIIEEDFFIQGRTFKIVDVGGQKNERRKWMHCFSNVNAIVFVAALSEFNQSLFEDETENRLMDAINLFGSICSNKDIKGVPIILFLNKSDLFKDKVAKVNLSDIPLWKDYAGTPFSFEEGAEYFLRKFIAANSDPTKSIYHHVTCATNTHNIQFVWSACTHIILQQQVREMGFAM